jgi:MoxR-like ATPase
MQIEAKELDAVKAKIDAVRAAIGTVIVGQTSLVDALLIAILADGHLLLEGVPGIAKTLAANTFSKVLALDFKRIQFTPDLLPSDIVGTPVFNPKEGTFFVQKGPIFTNVVLADEINRAPPKVQSALLEVMQEQQVTISGETFAVKYPFLVLATQNPIEHEGTYPLPEAQVDRFMMKVKIDYPKKEEEREIVIRMCRKEKPHPPLALLSEEDIRTWRALTHAVYIDEKILRYIIDIVFATRAPQDAGLDIGRFLEYGASPRASLYLTICAKAHALLEGRTFVTPFDIRKIAPDVLRHRLILSYEAEAEGVSAEDIIGRIFDGIPVP